MAELKTKVNKASVDKFIKSVKDEQTRDDCFKIAEIMQKATKAEPKMWGTSIVGFGTYHYKGASGREGDWFVAGFSPFRICSNDALSSSCGWAGMPD